MLELKQALALSSSAVAGRSQTGGFLLGTTAEGYAMRIHAGSCWILDDDDTVRGFAITLPDPVFRASELWSRRDAVAWSMDPAPVEARRLAYFDQLAVDRSLSARRWSVALALVSLLEIVEQGAEILITATVREPFINLAAVPFIERLGGRIIGRIDEHYPEIGDLVSDIWMVEPEGWSHFLAEHSRRAGQSLARARAALDAHPRGAR